MGVFREVFSALTGGGWRGDWTAAEERLWLDRGSQWFVPGTGAVVTPETAFNLSAVWACQTLLADSIATLPVDTYRKKDNTRVETVAPNWVETPNVENDRVDYDTQRMLSLTGWGNAYSLLVRQGGSSDPLAPVLERWNLAPSCVDVQRIGADLAYFVEGERVPRENIQHIRGYVLPGHVYGMSVIQKARTSFGIAVNADEFGSKLLKNGISPSGVLKIPQLPAEVSKDVVDRLREQFAERYAGSDNAGKPLALTGGTEWQQVTLNPVDAQFLETRKFQIEEICRWFRVPLHKVQQIMSNASQGGGNGLEQMSIEFAQDGLLPWTIRLERADSRLLPRGQYERYNTNAYVRADIKTRHEVYQIRRNIGMDNADELRALEDEPPIADGKGKDYWMPANFVVVGATPDAPSPGPQGADNGSQ